VSQFLTDAGQDTVLVADTGKHRVSQFKTDGTFIRIFAGTGSEGSSDGGFSNPCDIVVLGLLKEVAVSERTTEKVRLVPGQPPPVPRQPLVERQATADRGQLRERQHVGIKSKARKRKEKAGCKTHILSA
jgi:hypothetical protein